MNYKNCHLVDVHVFIIRTKEVTLLVSMQKEV